MITAFLSRRHNATIAPLPPEHQLSPPQRHTITIHIRQLDDIALFAHCPLHSNTRKKTFITFRVMTIVPISFM